MGNYILGPNGEFASVDELYHGLFGKGKPRDDHKYIKREWKNGKWVYTYKSDSKSGKKTKRTVDKTVKIEKKTSVLDSLAKWFGIDARDKARAAEAQKNQAKKMAEKSTKDYREVRDKANEDGYVDKREHDAITDAERDRQYKVAAYSKAGEAYVSAQKEFLETPLGKLDKLGKNIMAGFDKAKQMDVIDVARNTIEKMHELENKTWHLLAPVKVDLKFSDLKRQDAEGTPDEDMAAVNPNYSQGGDYDQNCAMCSFAYELRRRGYDVEAVAEGTSNNLGDGGGLMSYQIYDLYKEVPDENKYEYNWTVQEKYSKERNKQAYQQFVDEVAALGDGTRGELHIIYAGFGSGHSMAWEVEDGEVVIRDAQVNKVIDLDELIAFTRSFQALRTDNLEISDEALAYVKNREAKR